METWMMRQFVEVMKQLSRAIQKVYEPSGKEEKFRLCIQGIGDMKTLVKLIDGRDFGGFYCKVWRLSSKILYAELIKR
jgi:hypothetical protein